MTQAILAALFHHSRTGEGQFVEVPMLECVASFNLVENMFVHTFDPPTGQWSYTRSANPHRKPFATKDGYIGLLPYTDAQWDEFFKIAGWADALSGDPRFADFRTRAHHIGELYAMVEDVTRTRTTDEWLALLKPLSIPVVKMNRFDDLPGDPHLEAVDFFQRYEHPDAGAYVGLRPPVSYSKTPANIRLHPPRLGQHTDDILAELELLDQPE
jgi:crotonobetainyl-CoA:carnitine CoA-transferase CaiB-like acyl-CoA transferase